MPRLLTYTDMTIRDFSDNLKNEQFDPFIEEAEEIDIKQILGNEFFTAVANDPTSVDPDYVLLLDGGTYTCGDGTFEFRGVRYALQYYSLGRYIDNPETYTNSGPILHEEEFSTRSDLQQLKHRANNTRSAAFSIMQDAIDFLNRNSVDYPLYKCLAKNRSGKVRLGTSSHIRHHHSLDHGHHRDHGHHNF